jgi:hypothetical protein
MKYEKTPVTTKPSKTAVRSTTSLELAHFSTSAVLWHLVKRHKFGLVVTYASVLTAVYFMPFLPDLLFSLV